MTEGFDSKTIKMIEELDKAGMVEHCKNPMSPVRAAIPTNLSRSTHSIKNLREVDQLFLDVSDQYYQVTLMKNGRMVEIAKWTI
jgi:hypothetical protein